MIVYGNDDVHNLALSAIRMWRPKAVFSVGLTLVDPDSHVGDVLVSKTLEIPGKGWIVPADTFLIRKFRGLAFYSWELHKKHDVILGEFVSGSQRDRYIASAIRHHEVMISKEHAICFDPDFEHIQKVCTDCRVGWILANGTYSTMLNRSYAIFTLVSALRHAISGHALQAMGCVLAKDVRPESPPPPYPE